MEQTALSDILSDKEPETPKPEVTETPETPETSETHQGVVEEKPLSRRKQHLAKEYESQGRDPDTGQFLPKEEQKEEAKEAKEEEVEEKAEVKPEQPKVDFSDKERALLRAAEEERRKRQDLERKLAEYEKSNEDKKTFWDDPDGHLKAFEQSIDQKISQKEMSVRLATTEAIARTKYKDFDVNVQEFAQVLQATPGLKEAWLASPDPAEFAYRFGERTKLVREAGSLDELKARIEKETRSRLEAEFKVKQKELEQQRAALTPSLSDVRGAVRQSQPVFTGPTPFEEIIKP